MIATPGSMSDPLHCMRRVGLLLLISSTMGSVHAQVRPQHGEPPAPNVYAASDLLVTPAQISAWRADAEMASRLVLIDARAHNAYAAGHIPGAVHLDSDRWQDLQRPPNCLPSPEQIQTDARTLGIRLDSKIVVYDENNGLLASRIWFVLFAHGHPSVALLNGGLARWRDERLPISSEPHAPAAGTWSALPLAHVVSLVELERYRPSLSSPATEPPSTMLDARSYAEYRGEDLRAERGGHIPGAINLPWDAMLYHPPEVIGTARKKHLVWREPEEIYALLRVSGIVPGSELVIYDQTGGRSAHLYFTLRLLGFNSVSIYYAGWREYGNRKDVLVGK